MSMAIFFDSLKDGVEVITANETDVPGITLSADGKTANIWNVKLTGKTKLNDMSYLAFPSSLKKADLRGLDTSAVTVMNQMFTGCQNLTELDLSSFDTSNVTDMYQMFAFCTNLNSLDLSSFDTSKVTHIEIMFLGFGLLTTNPVVYYGSEWDKTDAFDSDLYSQITFTLKQ